MNSKTPVKSIREHCIQCSAGSKGEVLHCVIPDCPLFPYRLGRNPARKRKEKQPENAKNY